MANSNPSNQEDAREKAWEARRLSPAVVEALKEAERNREAEEFKPAGKKVEDKPSEFNGRKFEEAYFVAFIQPGMTFNRNGEMVVKLTIPHKFRDEAYKLADAIEVPVDIVIKGRVRGEPY